MTTYQKAKTFAMAPEGRSSTIASVADIAQPEDRADYRGLLIALTILLLWTVSLLYCLSIPLESTSRWQVALTVLWQTFLYTGLFITAHDAMHGSIFPQNLKVNHAIGQVALLVYALFPYKKLLQKHWQHHRYPASQDDPDFHDGVHRNIFAWYLTFMRRYVTWQQVAQLISLFYVVHWALHIPENNLYLFWIVPAFLSSLQLFFFGTFIPHHEPDAGYSNSHRAETYPMPVFWSFVTCYHFGYHHEHHEHPHVPWWQLPAVHKQPPRPETSPSPRVAAAVGGKAT